MPIVRLIPGDEINVNSLIMWTNERAVAPELPNADFASTCNWVFGYIKGTRDDKCMIQVIGQLYQDDTMPAAKTGHFIIIRPTTFLVPTGLNRDSAKYLLAHFETYNSNVALRSEANKRQRSQPPITLRTSNTNQGESSIHLQDIDGNYHSTREKKELRKRSWPHMEAQQGSRERNHGKRLHITNKRIQATHHR